VDHAARDNRLTRGIGTTDEQRAAGGVDSTEESGFNLLVESETGKALLVVGQELQRGNHVLIDGGAGAQLNSLGRGIQSRTKRSRGIGAVQNSVIERNSESLGDIRTEDFHVVAGVSANDLGGDHGDSRNLGRLETAQADFAFGGFLLTTFANPRGNSLLGVDGKFLPVNTNRDLPGKLHHGRRLTSLLEIRGSLIRTEKAFKLRVRSFSRGSLRSLHTRNGNSHYDLPT